MVRGRRIAGLAAAMAVIGAGLVLAGSTTASAAGTLTPSAGSVAAGGSLTVTASGCPYTEQETPTGFISQRPEVILVTGSGADERLAAFGERRSESGLLELALPGWLDPAAPAVVGGRCVRTTYTYDPDAGQESETVTTRFTYPDAPIDITPKVGNPLAPVLTLDRSTAAGGQVITVTGSGCAGAEFADVSLVEGEDLSGRTIGRFLVGSGSSDGVASDGTFTIELALNTQLVDGGDGHGGPVPEGAYTLLGYCGTDAGPYVLAEPRAVTVAGTNPSGSFELTQDGDQLAFSGAGCTGGRQVTVRVTSVGSEGGPIFDTRGRVDRALARRSLRDAARADRAATRSRRQARDDSVTTEVVVSPEADGTWSGTMPAPTVPYEVYAVADCGDPTADGFRYVDTNVFEDGRAELYVVRSSPTASPAGGRVHIEVEGDCAGPVTVAIERRDGTVLDESAPFELGDASVGSGDVTAPSTPGSYGVTGRCDDESGFPDPYEVFAPATVSAEAPLPDDPTTGWPSRGPREVYHGRIGPITLPAMDSMDGMAAAKGGAKLGSSGLFIPVPRPEGDLAITKMAFDLVDADGMPVSQHDAHLHHFVITNKSKPNPACPSSTFGLPGQIVGAAGAERTVLQLRDPYATVVKASDAWTGVYELMSRADHPQQVYLTYDITYRRDIDNVRPVTTYFGSATGCSSFTWTIFGSGKPDTQSTYVTMAKSGRLIGAGGHIHNGGESAVWTNDRGRELCRSVLTLGDEPMDMTGMHAGPKAATSTTEMATTTMVVDPTDPYPPEFYPDDMMIERINGCGLNEPVSAGERLRFDATYANERPRSGVMGIYTAYVWEGGGPAAPVPTIEPPPANAVDGSPDYTG